MLHTDLCLGHSAEAIAELTGAHVTTARRWKRGHPPPEPIRRFLRLLHEKDLGVLDPTWRGWRLTWHGTLASPEDWQYTPGEVRALTLLRAELARRESRREIEARPPMPGTCLDWIDRTWTYAATPAAHERPVWRDVIEASRVQGPYPRLARQR